MKPELGVGAVEYMRRPIPEFVRLPDHEYDAIRAMHEPTVTNAALTFKQTQHPINHPSKDDTTGDWYLPVGSPLYGDIITKFSKFENPNQWGIRRLLAYSDYAKKSVKGTRATAPNVIKDAARYMLTHLEKSGPATRELALRSNAAAQIAALAV